MTVRPAGTLSAAERARLPRPHGREAIWAALRAAEGAVTRRQIWQAVNHGQRTRETSLDTVRDYLSALAKAGFVKIERGAPGKAHRYRLLGNSGPVAPRVRADGRLVDAGGDGRLRMWRAMPVLKEFDRIELAIHANVAEETAKEYTTFLYRAGYLEISRRESRGPGQSRLRRWRFLPQKFTGPAAPVITKVKALWDPNIGETVYARHAGKEAA